jgi:ABC-type uncharacterized transport system ATPase subunit
MKWASRGTRDAQGRTEGEAVIPYGHRKLAELARAIAEEPLVMLLDKPVAGLNDREAQEISGSSAASAMLARQFSWSSTTWTSSCSSRIG